MKVQTGHKHELPDANTHQEKKKCHGKDSEPLKTGSGTVGSKTVISNVLREINPVDFRDICQSAGAVTGFKSCKPKGLIEPEGFQVALHESLAKDPTRKLAEVAGFDIVQLPNGQLCRSAHGFKRDASLLALRTQLVSELDDTFRSAPPGRKLTEPAPIV